MSNWHYVAIAYTVTWGSLAVYGLLLARRVIQAREVERALRRTQIESTHATEQDGALCDAPPAP